MGGQRKMVDLSPFLLFEAAGDSSEADFHHPNTQPHGDQIRCDSYDDDDAESSCSHGTERDGDGSSTLKGGHPNDDNDDKSIVHSNRKGDWELSSGRCVDDDDGSYGHHRHMDVLQRSKSSYCSRFEQEEEEEEEEGEEEDLLRSEVASTANSYSSRSRTKSKCMLRSKSKRKKRTSEMNEKEKNKLFWENCLSSKSFSKICSRFLFP